MTVKEPDGLFQQAINFLDNKINVLLKTPKNKAKETQKSLVDAAGAEHKVEKEPEHFFKYGSKFEDLFNDMLLSPSLGKLVKKINKYSSESKLKNLSPQQKLIVLKALRKDLANAIKGRQKLITRMQEDDLKTFAQKLAFRLSTFTDSASLKGNVDKAWTSLGELDQQINQLDSKIKASAQETLKVTPQALQVSKAPQISAKSNLRVLGDWDNRMDELNYLGGKLGFDEHDNVIHIEREPGLPILKPLQVGRRKESKAVVKQLLDDIERIQKDGTDQERKEIDVLIHKMEKPENEWLKAVFDHNPKLSQRLDALKQSNVVESGRKITEVEKQVPKRTAVANSEMILAQVDKRLEQVAGQFQTIDHVLDKVTDPNEKVFREQFIYGARSVLQAEEIFAALDKRMQQLQEEFGKASKDEKPKIEEQAKILFNVATQMITKGVLSNSEVNSNRVQTHIVNMEKVRRGSFPGAPAIPKSLPPIPQISKPGTKVPAEEEIYFLSLIDDLAAKQSPEDRQATIKKLVEGFSGIQAARFKNVTFSELYNQAWTKEAKDIKSPNVVNATDNFNQMVHVLGSYICNPLHSHEERARIIEGLIDLEHEFIKNADFADALIIHTALGLTPVSRLKNTWSLVSKEHKNIHTMLSEETLDTASNFMKYKHKIAAYSGMKAVPLLNTVLGEITTMDENRKNLDEELDHLNQSAQQLPEAAKKELNPKIKAKTEPVREGAKQRLNLNKIALIGRYFIAMQDRQSQLTIPKVVDLDQLTPNLEAKRKELALERYNDYLQISGKRDDKKLIEKLNSNKSEDVADAIENMMYAISLEVEPRKATSV